MKGNLIVYPIKAQRILASLGDVRRTLLMSHEWNVGDVVQMTDECILAIDLIMNNVRSAFRDMDIENEQGKESDNRQLG